MLPERADPPQDVVAIEVPIPAAALRDRLGELLAESRREGEAGRSPPPDWLQHFEAVPVSAPPGSQQVEAPSRAALTAMATDNPALRGYLDVGDARRRYDLYLFQPTGPHFWPSEYQGGDGQPVDFSTHFILHLDASGPERTRLEVIEVNPRLRLGRTWALAKHAMGIARVEDLRRVAPTTRDRQQLLSWILAQMERELPAVQPAGTLHQAPADGA